LYHVLILFEQTVRTLAENEMINLRKIVER